MNRRTGVRPVSRLSRPGHCRSAKPPRARLPRSTGTARRSTGARGWGRTIDARAFNAALYRLSYPGKKTSWRNVLDSNQWANSRRPRLSKPAPWTTRPTFLILWCPQRCSRTRPAAYRAAALPLSYGGESSSSSIRLCPCAKDAHCCAPDRFAAHQGRPGAHGALARSWARSKAIVQGHTRIERETAGA